MPSPAPAAEPDGAEATSDVGALSYEQARAGLEQVVQRLEDKDLPLEEMMTLWERGEALAARCDEHLAGAKERLDAVRRAVADRGSADSARG